MHWGKACFYFNFKLACNKIGFCYKIVVVRVRYQSVFRGFVPSVLGKVAKEREIYAPLTALCVKLFSWNAIKRELEIPVFQT